MSNFSYTVEDCKNKLEKGTCKIDQENGMCVLCLCQKMTIPLKLENKYLDERGKINLDFPMEVLSSKLKENLRDTY